MLSKPVYVKIARTFQAYQNCIKSNNQEWKNKHEQDIIACVENCLPYGSGIDAGIRFDFEKSTPDKLIFYFSYHDMDENGYYAGWYDYKMIITPSLAFDFDIRIVGKDTPNQAKEYLYGIFQFELSETVED
jgi:hypothetical protein